MSVLTAVFFATGVGAAYVAAATLCAIKESSDSVLDAYDSLLAKKQTELENDAMIQRFVDAKNKRGD